MCNYKKHGQKKCNRPTMPQSYQGRFASARLYNTFTFDARTQYFIKPILQVILLKKPFYDEFVLVLVSNDDYF